MHLMFSWFTIMLGSLLSSSGLHFINYFINDSSLALDASLESPAGIVGIIFRDFAAAGLMNRVEWEEYGVASNTAEMYYINTEAF